MGASFKHRLPQDKKGFTLLEIVIVLFLVSLVFMLVYTIYNTSLKVYQNVEERIDAQSQFRLVIGILENEVGTATEVELLHMDEIPDPVPPGYKCIYVKTDGNKGYFYSKTEEGEKEYASPYPLKDLSMKFRQGTSKNVLEVFLHAKDTNDYYGSILTQNAELVYIELMDDYEVVYFKLLDL